MLHELSLEFTKISFLHHFIKFSQPWLGCSSWKHFFFSLLSSFRCCSFFLFLVCSFMVNWLSIIRRRKKNSIKFVFHLPIGFSERINKPIMYSIKTSRTMNDEWKKKKIKNKTDISMTTVSILRWYNYRMLIEFRRKNSKNISMKWTGNNDTENIA